MSKPERIERLRRLQSEADDIRRYLRISGPSSVIYQAELEWDYDQVIVEADGFGGATTMVVEGNYPIDYFAIADKFFPNEREACAVADLIVSGSAKASEILDIHLR